MEKNKVALVGVGKWGKRLAKALDAHFELSYTIHKDSPETVAWLTENLPDVPRGIDIAVALNDPTVSLIAIATPIRTHFEIAKQALEAGKHVFIEKPGSETSAQLNELIKEAERRNLLFIVGYEFTTAPELEQVKKILYEETIRKVTFTWKKWGTFDTHPVINLMVHDFSMLKTLGLWPIENIKYQEVAGGHNPDRVLVEATVNDIAIVIDIDRASQVREKTITIETDSETHTITNTETGTLLETEIAQLAEILHGAQPLITDGRFATEILAATEQLPYNA